ncbi:MAG TPA: septum formation initiator family protein [Longimicrobiaceae bacterium]|nr:septum formation initiator family protein [Longimicrobiaceae bacterium]
MGLTPRAGRRLAAGALLAVAAYYAVWGGEYSAFDLLRLRRQGEETKVHLAQTRAEVDSLRLLARKLERDDATIERIARERFGMIAQGELLYRFVEVGPAAAKPAEAASGP